MFQHCQFATLLTGLELQLPAQHVDHGAQVDNPRHRLVLAEQCAAMTCRRGHRLGSGDGEACRHTGALIHRARFAEITGEAGDDLQQVLGHLRREMGLLADDTNLGIELTGIVGADLGAEAILERGDDAAAVGVVLRVGASDDEHIQGQPQRVTTNLDIPLFHDVEHGDLDALGEVG